MIELTRQLASPSGFSVGDFCVGNPRSPALCWCQFFELVFWYLWYLYAQVIGQQEQSALHKYKMEELSFIQEFHLYVESN